MEQFSRTELVFGKAGIQKLNDSKVIVFGVGGVGGYAVEGLIRAGVGNLTLVDNDVVTLSNLNRQIHALHSTIGKFKTEVAAARCLDVNPNAAITPVNAFYSAETQDAFDLSGFDYVIDAIDTITSKVLLIKNAKKAETPIISSMGAGNKLDPTKFVVADIYETSVCPLARKMRTLLKKENVDSLKVVYSEEKAIKICSEEKKGSTDHPVPSSVSFVPSVVGLIIAGEVIKDIING